MKHVRLTRDEEQTIQSAIDLYLKDPTFLGLTADLIQLARSLNALPTYADMFSYWPLWAIKLRHYSLIQEPNNGKLGLQDR